MLVLCDSLTLNLRPYLGYVGDKSFNDRMLTGEHLYMYVNGSSTSKFAVKCEGLNVVDGIIVHNRASLDLRDYCTEIHCKEAPENVDVPIYVYPSGMDCTEANMNEYCEALYRAFARPCLANKEKKIQYLNDAGVNAFRLVYEMIVRGDFETLEHIKTYDSRLRFADVVKLGEKWT